jgi:RNA polymerase sigma factor (sigma-70 family)
MSQALDFSAESAPASLDFSAESAPASGALDFSAESQPTGYQPAELRAYNPGFFKQAVDAVRNKVLAPMFGASDDRLKMIKAQAGEDPNTPDEQFFEKFPGLKLEAHGLAGSLWEGFSKERLPSLPKISKETTDSVPTVLQPWAKTQAGSYNAMAGLVDFFKTPAGVATLGMGGLPKATQAAISAFFAKEMLTAAPQEAEAVAKAWENGDQQGVVEHGLGLAMNTGMGAMAGFHSAKAGLQSLKPSKPTPPRIDVDAEVAAREQADADLRARNNMAPGTLRPREQQVYAPPQADAPAGMVKAEGPVFERQGFFKEPQNERQIRFEEPVERALEPKVDALETGGRLGWARTAEDFIRDREPLPGQERFAEPKPEPVRLSEATDNQRLSEAANKAPEPRPAPVEAPLSTDTLPAARALTEASKAETVPLSEMQPAELEAASQRSNLLERQARRTRNSEQLDSILKEAVGLPFESRIANEVASNPFASDTTFEAAINNAEARKMANESYFDYLRQRRAELRGKQEQLAPHIAPQSAPHLADPLSAYIQTEPAMARARSIASKYAEQLGESAEDLAVEGISHVWQKVEAGAAKGVDAAKVENWTSTAIKNYYLDQVKNKSGKRLREAERFGEPEGEGLSLDQRLSDKGVTPEQAVQVSELTSVLEKALPKLDNISRDLLQKRMVGEEFSLSDAARQHGITPEAVRQRWAKATKTLVEALDEAGYDGESFLAIKERLEKAKPSNGNGGRLYGGIPFFDPALYRPLIQFGTSVAAKTGRQFSAWSKAMTNLLGDKVVPYLKHVWNMIGRAGEDVLRKANLPDLADRLRKFEDRERASFAEWLSGYEALQQRYTRSEFKQAHREAEQYMRLRERGANSKQQLVTFRAEAMRYEQGMSRAGRALVKWMQETGIKTGDLADRLGIEVQDGAVWRKMVNMGELHFPRNLSERTQEIIRDPEAKGSRAEYQQLLRDLVSNGNAKTIAEADAMVRRQFSTLIKGDHFGNAEKARGMKLPDRYYDYSVDNYLRFLRRFAKRSAQIEAFGQAKGEQFAPEFQKALDTTRDPRMQRYLGYLHNVVHDVRAETPGQRALDASRKVAAGAFLSGPVTAIRNFESSVRNSAETFGVTATSKALAVTMKDSAVAMGKSVARAFKGDVRLAKPESVRVAQEIGAVQRDLKAATIMDLETTGEGVLDRVNRVALGVNGVAERLGRTVNAGAAMTWLRHTQELVKANGGINSTSYRVRARLATLKRLGYEGQVLSDLMAGRQEVVNRYVRDAVREKQYGYTVSQAPLAFDTASGKFFLQFQKWGVQRVRDLHRNIIKPAFKGEVVNGKRTFDAMPLLRFSVLTVAGAEGLKLIAEGLFGRQSKTASNEELLATLSEDEARAVELTAERLIHDVVMEGGLGLIGDYYGIVQNATERGKFKSPINPPAFSFLNGLKDLVVDQVQRGGDLSALGRDVATYFRTYPLAAQVEGMAVNALEATGQGNDHTADRANARDRSWVRSLVQRYAEETGLDASVPRSSFKAGKTEQTEVYDRLQEALSRGDAYAAKQVIRAFAGEPGMPGYRDSLQKLKGSVRNRHVLDTYGVSTAQERRGFMEWAKRRVPSKADELERMVRTYEETAREVGLR